MRADTALAPPLDDARILIVDDEPANVRLLERLLAQVGYRHLTPTTDSREVVRLFQETRPDLILLDLHMPHLDGFAILEALRTLIPPRSYLPILVLTADATPEARQRALAMGAKDFATKPLDHLEVLLRIKNLLETRLLHRELERHAKDLERLVEERTQQLLQTEKLATMGQLLAGVAHELNNPLSVVLGQAMLLRQSVDGTPAAARAEKISAAAERCARIVKNFLALARQRPPERRATALNGVIREAIELLVYPLRTDGVEVSLDLASDLPAVWADPHQIHQVLVNLITNAHHAMRERPEPRRLTVTSRLDPARAAVRIAVGDTGGGIPPEVADRIFEPFFTTKPAGQGTGLGLPLCRGMVESHGGTLTFATTPGAGSVFSIELPVPRAAAAEPAGSDPAPPARAGSGRVLVVDDEPELGAILADMLGAAGYTVDTAANGRVALERLAAAAYDVILSDLKMPELDGEGLYREIVRRHPRLRGRLVFMTGDQLSAETRRLLEDSDVPSVAKPFTTAELLAAVQRVAGMPATPP